MKISLYSITLINALLLSACSNAVEDVSQPPKNPTEVVDIKAPVILRTAPAANAANIDRFSSVSVSFSEKIDSASINEQSVKLFYLPAGQNQQLMKLNGNEGIKYSDPTLVISPEQPFIKGGLYQVRLLANSDSELSIKDPAGNALEANDQNIYYSWTFTISTVVQDTLTAISPLTN